MLFIDEIRIEHTLSPVVTDNPQPRFSFSLTSTGETLLSGRPIFLSGIGEWK